MNRSSRRESALISLGDGSRWGEVIRLTPDATRFRESSLFLSDLLTGHEPWRSTQSAIRNQEVQGRKLTGSYLRFPAIAILALPEYFAGGIMEELAGAGIALHD